MHKKTKKIGIVIIILIISIVYLWDRVWVMYPPIFPEINYVWVYLTVNEKNVNNYDSLGRTKFYKAVYKKKYKTANLLIKRGANIDEIIDGSEYLLSIKYQYWSDYAVWFCSDGVMLSIVRCSLEFNKQLIDILLEKKIIRIDLIKMLVRINYYEKEILNNYEKSLKEYNEDFKYMKKTLGIFRYIRHYLISDGRMLVKIDSKSKLKKRIEKRDKILDYILKKYKNSELYEKVIKEGILFINEIDIEDYKKMVDYGFDINYILEIENYGYYSNYSNRTKSILEKLLIEQSFTANEKIKIILSKENIETEKLSTISGIPLSYQYSEIIKYKENIPFYKYRYKKIELNEKEMKNLIIELYEIEDELLKKILPDKKEIELNERNKIIVTEFKNKKYINILPDKLLLEEKHFKDNNFNRFVSIFEKKFDEEKSYKEESLAAYTLKNIEREYSDFQYHKYRGILEKFYNRLSEEDYCEIKNKILKEINYKVKIIDKELFSDTENGVEFRKLSKEDIISDLKEIDRLRVENEIIENQYDEEITQLIIEYKR